MQDIEAARAKLIQHLKQQINDARVIEAMSLVPRELFVPERYRALAYEDEPLGIGFGQTISQPFIVALMTQALDLKENEKVLELGTGSGYQTAILAQLAAQVISIERIPALAEKAQNILNQLGYTNVEVQVAGKDLGWPQAAPYDAIIVTAGAPRIPSGLLEQLAQGGRLVIPAGSREIQSLYKITKGQNGNLIQDMGGCHFVPLIGQEGWQD